MLSTTSQGKGDNDIMRSIVNRILLIAAVLLTVECLAGGASVAPARHSRVKFFRAPRKLAKDAVTSNWPRFLGPTGDGVSLETKLVDQLAQPQEGKPDPMLVWALTKGRSFSAPSISEGRLICFHRMANSEVVECLEAETGRLYWTSKYPTSYKDEYGYLDGPRASPAIDGDRVYTVGALGVLQCLNLATGQVLWRRDLVKDFKLNQGFFGFSSSPLVEGERVIVNLGLGKCVASFDKRTGKLAWVSGDQWGCSYATPVAATVHGKRVLFVFAGGKTDPPVGGLLCLDPGSGKIHFRHPWRSRNVFSVNAATPVVSGNRVYISSTYGVGGVTLAVNPDLTHRTVYKTKACASHWATPILHDGHLYGFANAVLFCMEWSSGRRLWHRTLRLGGDAKEEGQTHSGQKGRRSGFGSLIRADGRFLVLGDTGLLAWVDLTPKGCRIHSARRLFNAPHGWTAPVLSRGLLYIMQNQPGKKHPPRLLCYDLRGR